MNPTRVWRSVLGRPLTTLYLMASGVIVAGFAGWIEGPTAIVILTFMFVILLVLGLYRENKVAAEAVAEQLGTIHTLVNSQHDDLVSLNAVLVERIDQLIDVLTAAGITVPAPPEKGTR